MKLTWFGHSAVRAENGGHVILIDPFLSGNPKFNGSVEEAARGATHVVLTHGHDDHVGDAAEICNNTGATLVAVYELAMFLADQGVSKIEAGNPGGTIDLGGGVSVSFVKAFHSSSTSIDGEISYLGNPTGVVISAARLPRARQCSAPRSASLSKSKERAAGGRWLPLRTRFLYVPASLCQPVPDRCVPLPDPARSSPISLYWEVNASSKRADPLCHKGKRPNRTPSARPAPQPIRPFAGINFRGRNSSVPTFNRTDSTGWFQADQDFCRGCPLTGSKPAFFRTD